jgi:endogenous inhibitor of DNA gyrase (YacG/DUF329 family)
MTFTEQRNELMNYSDYINEQDLHCLYCGKPIVYDKDSHRGIKYCNAECAKKQNIINDAHKRVLKRMGHDKCVVCGAHIEQTRLGKMRLYCSYKCRKISFNLRKASSEEMELKRLLHIKHVT